MSESRKSTSLEPILAPVAGAGRDLVKVERDMKAFDELFARRLGPSRPRFAELSEEPPFKPLPRDYAWDLGNGVRPTAPAEQPVGALFAEQARRHGAGSGCAGLHAPDAVLGESGYGWTVT